MPNTPSRNDVETTSPGRLCCCPVCGVDFLRNRRQRYCSPACRQAAWRARHPKPPTQTHTATTATRRPCRDTTVYACGERQQRYLGEQWCPDCHRPCRRVDIGGLCPHCDEPVAVTDLLP
jgi:hypothetical protein